MGLYFDDPIDKIRKNTENPNNGLTRHLSNLIKYCTTDSPAEEKREKSLDKGVTVTI